MQAIELAEHVLKEADKALVSAAEFAPGEEAEFRKQISPTVSKPTPESPNPNDLDALIAEHRRKHKIA